MTVQFTDSNEYEVRMDGEFLEPEERIDGLPDDRVYNEAEFEVNEELSCSNTDFGEFEENKL